MTRSYLLDAYEQTAASAVCVPDLRREADSDSAANTILRSLTAAGFPLWVEVTLNKWGVGWACSLQGFVAVGLAFVPLVFLRYGERCVTFNAATRAHADSLRARSPYAPSARKPVLKTEKEQH